jgi:hypothetical protein
MSSINYITREDRVANAKIIYSSFYFESERLEPEDLEPFYNHYTARI